MANIKKFEAYVGDDGKLDDFDSKTKLEKFFGNKEDALSAHGIRVTDDEEDTWMLTNDAEDLYIISDDITNDAGGFEISFSTADGKSEHYFLNDEAEMMDDILRKMFRSQKNIAPIDVMDYKFNKDSLPSENEEVMEKKNSKSKEKDSIVGTTTLTTPEASIKQNKGYNFDPTPGHKDSNPWYSNVISKRIEIGTADPVKAFQEWSGKFWRRDGDQYKKYEPNSGVPEEEETVELKDKDNSTDHVNIGNAEQKFKNWDSADTKEITENLIMSFEEFNLSESKEEKKEE